MESGPSEICDVDGLIYAQSYVDLAQESAHEFGERQEGCKRSETRATVANACASFNDLGHEELPPQNRVNTE